MPKNMTLTQWDKQYGKGAIYKYKVEWKDSTGKMSTQLFKTHADAALFQRILTGKGRKVSIGTGRFRA